MLRLSYYFLPQTDRHALLSSSKVWNETCPQKIRGERALTPVEERKSSSMSMMRRKLFEARHCLFAERLIRWAGLLIVVGFLFAGCSTPTASSATSATPSPRPTHSFAGLVDIG